MNKALKITVLLCALPILSACGGILNLLSPCPGPRPADALEPNDNPSNATTLQAKREASLNPGEQDVFQFEANAAQKYQLFAKIIEGNGNDNPGLNVLLEGPNNFRLEQKPVRAVPLEFTISSTGTHFLTVTDGSSKYADCFVCTCTGRGPSYSVELKIVP